MEIRVRVVNNGLNDVDDFAVELLSDGSVIKTIENNHLAAGATGIYTIVDHVTNASGNKVEYEAVIKFDADENIADDRLKSSPVEVVLANLPAVEACNGTESATDMRRWRQR